MSDRFMTADEFDEHEGFNAPDPDDYYTEYFNVELWTDGYYQGMQTVDLCSDEVNLSDEDEVFETIVHHFNEGADEIIVRITINGEHWTAWIHHFNDEHHYTIQKP
jgi:hypothetical protein